MGEAAAPTSLYRTVADDLRAAIGAGEYPPGTRLPSESDLAERYSVSRGTVRRSKLAGAAHILDTVAGLPALLGL